MPVKWVDDVKDRGLRAAGQEWQEAVGRKLTTRDLDDLSQRYAETVGAMASKNDKAVGAVAGAMRYVGEAARAHPVVAVVGGGVLLAGGIVLGLRWLARRRY